MDLKDLKCVVAIAETGSFIRASEKLNMSQPSVSARIRILEANLGLNLFERETRGVRITQEGQELLQHAKVILRQISEAEADMVSYRSTPVGLVRVGLPTSLTAMLAVPLLERCMSDMPNVKLRLVESMSGYLTQWLRDGTLDLSVTFGSNPPPDIEVEPLAREDLLLVGRSGADIAPYLDEDGSMPMARLSEIKLILPGPEHGLRSLVDTQARQQAVPINVAIEIDAFSEIKRLVARGLGFTIMSSAAYNDGMQWSLSAATIRRPTVSRVVNLASLSSRTLPRAAKEVAFRIRETVQQKSQGEDWFASAIISSP